jgi:hypothetical protein
MGKKKNAASAKKAKATNDKNTMTNKKYIIAGVSVGALFLIMIASAVILPFVKINADFDKIFSEAGEMKSPVMIITDMKADNVFSDAVGEVTVESTEKARELIKNLAGASKNFDYDSRNGDAVTALDIRIKISDGDKTLVFYMNEKGMYYISGGVRYYFVPRDNAAQKTYSELYSEICDMVR